MIRFGTNDISDVSIGNTKVAEIYFGNDLVWSSGDEFLVTITTAKPGPNTSGTIVPLGKYGVAIQVTAGSKECTVTFNSQTQTIPANTTQWASFYDDEQITADISIKGSFTNLVPFNQTASNDRTQDYAHCFNVQEIKKWFKKLDFVPTKLFYSTINLYIDLPSNITTMVGSFIGDLTFSTPNRLTFTDNLKNVTGFGCLTTFFSNATNNGDVWSVDGYVMAVYGTQSNAIARTDTFVIPTGTTRLAQSLFGVLSGLATFSLTGIQFPNDNLIQEIPNNFISRCNQLTTITFPASVTKFGSKACVQYSSSPFTELTFLEAANVPIEFPNAGSTDGFIYYKSASTKNIYTANNFSVLNYDWLADNVTATFYKLDRTTVISRLTTPTLTMSGTVLTISGDANSTLYEITISSTVLANSPVKFTTTSLQVDLSNYADLSAVGTYTITVRELATATNYNYAASLKATTTYIVE